MSRRFFTADLHLGSSFLIENGFRNFKSVEKMNDALISNINSRCAVDDVLIHAGDFMQYFDDRTSKGERTSYVEYIHRINPTVINLRGNHDDNNKMKSVCDSMRLSLGNLKSVSISHFPSYDLRSNGSFRPGDIHLHGHVHKGEVFTIDRTREVLNVNLCCDLWRFFPVSEYELIVKINNFIRTMEKKWYNDNVGTNRIINKSKD